MVREKLSALITILNMYLWLLLLLLFWFFKTGFRSVYLWLSWNSFRRLAWPQTQKSTCFASYVLGLKACATPPPPPHPQLKLLVYDGAREVAQRLRVFAECKTLVPRTHEPPATSAPWAPSGLHRQPNTCSTCIKTDRQIVTSYKNKVENGCV